VAKLLEKIRVSVQNKKILFEGTELSMTVSIGGCSRVVASEDEHTLLLAFVDKKLYEAKEDGRNCVKLDSY
jgi:PleD family two-component response regulator